MAERATEQITIDATPAELLGVLLDFPRYPDWAADIKDVEVLERDDEGRGTLVAYRGHRHIGRSGFPMCPLCMMTP